MLTLTKRWLLSETVHYYYGNFQPWNGHNLLSKWRLQARFFWHRLFPYFRAVLPPEVSDKVVRLSIPHTSRLFGFRRLENWPHGNNRISGPNSLTRRWTRRNGFLTGIALVGIQVHLPGHTQSSQGQEEEEQWRWQRFRKALKHLYNDTEEERAMGGDRLSHMNFDHIEIESFLDKGCNSAIYEVSLSNREESQHVYESNQAHPKSSFALKMLFNFDAESNGKDIFDAMGKECVPFVGTFGKNLYSIDRHRRIQLKRLHPNVVKVHGVFADLLPNLPDCGVEICAALPRRLNENGYGRNMTMFMLMKKYDTNLDRFLASHPFQALRSKFLLAQLFAGISFLNENQIAHRDLKANNLLIDLEHSPQYPWLVISDFGACCSPLVLHYSSDELCKGGNRSLMPPEVVNARPGTFSFIDYSTTDGWAGATIAYEIFGHLNPFYHHSSQKALNSANYSSDDLPSPHHMPSILQTLIKQLLSVDAKSRPTAKQAFVVCCLLMYFDRKLIKLIARDVVRQKYQDALHSIRNMLTVDFIRAKDSVPDAMLKLKVLFISEADAQDIWAALAYFR